MTIKRQQTRKTVRIRTMTKPRTRAQTRAQSRAKTPTPNYDAITRRITRAQTKKYQSQSHIDNATPEVLVNKQTINATKLRILHDIAGSFFSDIIGQNMNLFVNALKHDIMRNGPKHSNIQRLHVADFIPYKLRNEPTTVLCDQCVIPLTVDEPDLNEQSDIETIRNVHWIFSILDPKSSVKNQPNKWSRKDFIVYDPYEYNMQEPNSNQFCQTNALIIAKKYYTGQPIQKYNNVFEAYEDIIRFWEYLFGLKEIKTKITEQKIKETLTPIFELNEKEEKYKNAVREVIQQFPNTMDGILAIMKTEKAKRIFPKWK